MLLNTGDAARARPLTSGANLNLDPAWSPDGKRLAFVRTEPGGQFHIYVMPVENGRAGEPVRLTEPHSFGHARLYFERPRRSHPACLVAGRQGAPAGLESRHLARLGRDLARARRAGLHA